ncbi:MAG: thioredoxin [Alphaproteobacteria bacterium]|nr:thioredoxin [Alphaproteobacteria bacterium]
MEPMIGKAPEAGTGPLVKESGSQTFVKDVIEASKTQPVIVDFWAPWCGPCKQLGPILEREVQRAGGAVRMVKINIDQNQSLAQQLKVQSIPAVYAFKDGRPVDGFVGALPESQVKSFIARLTGGKGTGAAIDEALDQAKVLLDSGDHAGAGEIYSQVLAHEEGNPRALAGLARCLMAQGETEDANALIDGLSAELAGHAEITSVKAALALIVAAPAAEETAALRARLEANPLDHQARLDLATALFASGQREEAIDQLLELFRRDRKWNEEAARTQMVKFFEALGHTDPLTVQGRKRLSSLMFS